MSSDVVAFEPRDEADDVAEAVADAEEWADDVAAAADMLLASVLPAGLRPDRLARMRNLRAQAISDGTRRMYKREWARFVAFCKDTGADFLPAHPLTVASYFEEAATDGKDDQGTPYASNTFNGWSAAIDKMHQLAGFRKPSDSAEVQVTIAALRRTNGGELRRMPALLLEDMRHLVSTIDINNYPRGIHRQDGHDPSAHSGPS